ncbi:MAG: PA0069 family radical SAM protein [Gemmatimonadota bacterium]
MQPLPVRGRAAADNPTNRFTPIDVVPDDGEWRAEVIGGVQTRFFEDSSRSIISRNDSPDVGFDASVNPYRGCEVGCIYCYARTFHEYLGFSAGLDFETRILVKRDAPALLRAELASPRWTPQVIALSGATDPYQPAERTLRITRGCLEVLAEARNPVQIITKRDLVTRDIDLLQPLSALGAASVHVSITTLDQGLQRVMEPRGAAPYRRLETIRRLACGGVRVGVNVAPVIPGLTDHEVPAILEAAREAGAMTATYILLRLPFGIRELFEGWLERHLPDRREKVLGRIRETRAGRLYDGRFRVRGRGEGEYATQVHSMFRVAAARLGYEQGLPPLSVASFRAPRSGPQLGLFDVV